MGARSVSLGDLNGYVEMSRLRSARDVGLTNVRAVCVHCEVLSHVTVLCSDGAVDIVAVGYSDNQVALYVFRAYFSPQYCATPLSLFPVLQGLHRPIEVCIEADVISRNANV